MISQHWFRLWLGVAKQDAITNLDPDLCRRKASLGHNEFKCIFFALTSISQGLDYYTLLHSASK